MDLKQYFGTSYSLDFVEEYEGNAENSMQELLTKWQKYEKIKTEK